jgi:acetylornithine deacetylase
MKSLDILERLVSFPTVSCNSNLALIDFVSSFLGERGIGVSLLSNSTGNKANLYATVGPRDRSGVLLSGHTDVVPVEGQDWSSDPFTLKERAGCVYGRGTADMKGFLACVLAAVDRAGERSLKTPLHLAFSYDEEVGCLGVRPLIDAMRGWSVRPRLGIVGEPTELRAGIGHKGKTTILVRCHGQAAHSAITSGVANAIHLACDFISRARAQQESLARNGKRDPAYDVPHTTVHIGRIHGGGAVNMVPAYCEVELEVRNLCADDPAALITALQQAAEDVASSAVYGARGRIELEIINSYPGLETPSDDEVVQFLAAIGVDTSPIKVSFGTEGGLFSERVGIPTVICGPGSIHQAHCPDEFVSLDQLARCDVMLDRLLDRLC